ncbi:hypothetical protein R6Q59_028440 [Mikania micrantha]
MKDCWRVENLIDLIEVTTNFGSIVWMIDSHLVFNREFLDEIDGKTDYRDHNEDDSDSSEHNKSVQVESEEEEPVRRMGKKPTGKKAPAKRWSDEEEVALAISWLTISENLDVGNVQKRDVFYTNVTEHFHHIVKDKSMTIDQIYFKWNDMNSSMKKWNGFYQHASMNRKNGEGDEQILKKAMKDYKIWSSQRDSLTSKSGRWFAITLYGATFHQ